MNEHYYDEMINSVTSVTNKNHTIPLKYTGLNKKGGSTLAYEFEDPESGARYYLKITPNEDNGGGELRVLPKIGQYFKNEMLSEPDAVKRLGYVPVPTIITDDPSRFNPEFSKLFNKEESLLQLQTAAPGTHAERELPQALSDRLSILLNLAKLLRTCARNKIAYVDIKPLEHVFWVRRGGRIEITLIDWGIARANADPALLADDIRKFCETIPEIIYGKKMADLQFKGKLTYPIQSETRTPLISLLGTLTFNGELPPLTAEHAALISDLLSGSLNELRAQNRCVAIWDSIITALDQARLQVQNITGTTPFDTIEAQNRRAAAALSQNDPKDLTTALTARQISVASHPAWITAALRFTQAWYSRIDLIPHIEFDLTVKAVLGGQIHAALSTYQNLENIITAKLAQSQTLPELRQHISTYIQTIRQALEAWDYLDRYQRKQLTDGQLLTELSTSTLRVSDPILSDLYYNIRGEKNPAAENQAAPQTTAADPVPETKTDPADTPKPEKAAAPAETKAEPPAADPLADNTVRIAKELKLEADRTENFNSLRPTRFFQRLNDFCMNRSAFDNKEVREHTNPLLLTIIDRIDLWSQNIRPEKYFVTQEAVDSIDWIQNVSPVVYTCPIRYENRETQLGTIVKARLSEIFQSIYYSLAKEQTAGEPPEILQKVGQIKILRKRLDMENLTYIRSLIERGEFEAANQVINLHYSESPYTFDQLNNEIAQKRKDQADQKTLAVIDSVLNDLSSNDTKLETTRFLNNPKSAAMVSDRFFSFKNRGTQLFDLQDELSRTKNAIQDQKKTIHTMRLVSLGALLAAVITVILAVLLLTTTLHRNAGLQMSLDIIGTSAAQNQMDTNQMLQAVAQTAAVQPEFPTPVPTDIPTPTMIPTLPPEPARDEDLIIEKPAELQEPAVPEKTDADMRLDTLVGKDVTITLDASTRLFTADTLTTQLGSVWTPNQPLTGRLISYTDRYINIEAPFNIGRSVISADNDRNIAAGTYIRLYSNVPSETQPVLALQSPITLTAPAADCTEGPQSFCHGTISIWFDRTAVESSLR